MLARIDANQGPVYIHRYIQKHGELDEATQYKQQEIKMIFNSKVVLPVAALVFMALPVSSSFAMTAAECEALFEKADTDKDGSLAQMEDPKWEQRISHMSNITKKDQGMITKDQFMQSCKSGEMDGM